MRVPIAPEAMNGKADCLRNRLMGEVAADHTRIGERVIRLADPGEEQELEAARMTRSAGCSPTKTMSASPGPSPNTVWVAFFHEDRRGSPPPRGAAPRSEPTCRLSC